MKLRRVLATAGAVATVLALAACGGGSGSPLGSGQSTGAAAADVIRVGSADFPENRVLAEIYAQALEGKGVKVERHFGIGSREVYFPALTDGSIDLVPDYTGVLLQYIDKTAPQTESQEVYTALQGKVPPPLTVLDKAGAEDKDAVVVTAATAQQHNLRSIADLAPVAGQMVFGGPSEFETRPDGIPGIKKTYGVTFKQFRALDTGGPLTVAALKDGTVQAADLFTTDPSIPDNNFVVLEDPKSNFAAQNVVPLINESKATDQVRQALNAVSAKLTTDGLVALNRQLSAPDKPSVEVVAKQWLGQNGLA